jgi:protein-tyrosine phosphatase
LAQAAAAGQEITRRQWSIPDVTAPTVAQMRAILADIDDALQTGRTVYVHCYGGIGRTGTVVGCYLVNQGLSGAAALETITRLRQPLPKGYRLSPETSAQCDLVRTWRT